MNTQMKWYYIQLGGHTHVRAFMNGAKIGDLCFRNEEFDALFNDPHILKADAIDFVRDTTIEQAHGRLSRNETAQAKLVELCAELLCALKEAQSTLLHNGIDTGPLPGVSQRIRLAIANAELRSPPVREDTKSAEPSQLFNVACDLVQAYKHGAKISAEAEREFKKGGCT